MELYLDGRKLDAPGSPGGSIDQTLRDVQRRHCAPKQLVVALRCDDRDIPFAETASTLARPAASISKLEIFTSTGEQLVLGAMHQASQSLQDSEAACTRVAELLTEGQVNEALTMLGECMRAWQKIHEAVVQSIRMLELDVESAMINDTPFAEVIARPRDALSQIKQALTRQDHVLLADLLQYELGGVTDQWFSLIARLRQEAEDRERVPTEPRG